MDDPSMQLLKLYDTMQFQDITPYDRRIYEHYTSIEPIAC
jgi:hypothetical protein